MINHNDMDSICFIRNYVNWYGVDGEMDGQGDIQPVQTQETSSLSDCEVMQFTGKEDSEGVEIYEGDILSHIIDDVLHQNQDKTTVVKFDQEFRFSACHPDHSFGLPLTWGGYTKTYVVGNIYQNPELIPK